MLSIIVNFILFLFTAGFMLVGGIVITIAGHPQGIAAIGIGFIFGVIFFQMMMESLQNLRYRKWWE